MTWTLLKGCLRKFDSVMWSSEILLMSFRCKYNSPLFASGKAKSRWRLQVQLLMGCSEVWMQRDARSSVVFGPFKSKLTQAENKYADANKPK